MDALIDQKGLRQEEIGRLKVLAETWKDLAIIHYELSVSIGIENSEKSVSGYAASCYFGCVAGLEKEIKKLVMNEKASSCCCAVCKKNIIGERS